MDEDDSINYLIKNILKGDEGAFKKLYNVTHKKVIRYPYRFTDNRQMAEDILIDTYTEAWKSAGNFRY
jgi:DNA-directed RNA polymerase specialized sigma24 family protein